MLEFFSLVLISVFLSVNALGNLPLFISMLAKFKKKERKTVIRKSFVIAFVCFLLFSFFGKYIFEFMHIKFYSFYIAGGILLSIIALEMLLGKRVETKISEKEEKLLKERETEMENIAITPIAIPMLTGPGAITMGLMLFGSIQFNGFGTALQLIEFLTGTTLAYGFSFIIITKSDFIRRVVGKMGLKVMSRIMGLLLLSIGVQFVVNGVIEIIATL